ncbi:MAG TPA: DUF6776 family protein [Steroidobacteraceae bacterium]|nr:DUF6776 family protein [Steroidobacteraceae bacterium]
MDEIPRRLIVRAQPSAQRWLAAAMALVLMGVALYLAFEGGRYVAGYDAMQAATERSALQRKIDQLQSAQHGLQVQLAAAQEAQVSDIRERSEVARAIGELQAQVERQQQDVQFYRGLLAPQLGQQPDVAVRVQQFHINATSAAQQYLLRFTLNRIVQPERSVDGTLAITVDGSQAGMPATLDLASLAGGKQELPFNFRYYADIEQPITLPAAFKPDSVTIEVRPAGKSMAPYRQTFIWEVDPI